ncbi:MAG: NAD(P)H-quinone oxidoreductase [Defluviicoccus sp.]|nr:NAD(P)H-quinone oxidoreductase [Defluviicoccus sp.]MDE0386604.1 NAD(P)H-quinone oxidoreductase [Defluviicoccus sp.]
MAEAVPASMKAIEITQPGGPEMLSPCTREVPTPGAGEVLVRVEAAGVNFPDVAQRRGSYPPPPGASDLPGLELAGVVVARGKGVAAPAPGEAVCALVSGGGYAEYCAVPVPQCLPIPDGLSMVEAAALPETFFTVWTNLFDGGRLREGETVLIHGGSGGIGTAAIQIARAFGARVFATARTAEKCAFCERLGAERAIAYEDEDFVAVVRELTGKRGVDLILDMVGGEYLARNLRALAVEGRLVQIAVMAGAEATVPLGLLMVKRLTLTGSTLRPRSVAQKGAIADALKERVWPLLADGRLRPIVHATFGLEQAAEAHALMESSAHIGKIVLTN